jgi:metal-sulfur cluster biosynthetic enzyme
VTDTDHPGRPGTSSSDPDADFELEVDPDPDSVAGRGSGRDHEGNSGDPGRPRVTRAAVRERLRGVVDPCSESRGIGNDVIDLGLLEDIEIDDGHVTVSLRLTSPACHMVGHFNREITDRVGALDGVDAVTLETDSGLNWDPSRMTPEGRQRREAYIDRLRESGDD